MKTGFFFDVSVPQTTVYMYSFCKPTQIPRPKGNITLRAITIDLIDESGRTVALEQVYNHHLFIGTCEKKGRV